MGGVKAIADEILIPCAFKRRRLYQFFLRYLAPACLLIILVSSIANVLGWIQM